MIKCGDRVRLTEQGVRAYEDSLHKVGNPIDWGNRLGTLTRITPLAASVLWDGRSSIDRYPPSLVELVVAATEDAL